MTEKYSKDDAPRESIFIIEKSDEQYYEKLVYRPPSLETHPDLLDESTPLGKKYKKATELLEKDKVVIGHEKSKNKTSKKKSKRICCVSYKSAVESL